MEEGVQIGPLISKDALEKVEALMEESKRGGKLVVGGDRHELGGNFYQPTLVVDVKDDSSVRGSGEMEENVCFSKRHSRLL
jgi:succinate-semialdehyde dehydrogenase/glutarate-semialdehyde dehydrogenase